MCVAVAVAVSVASAICNKPLERRKKNSQLCSDNVVLVLQGDTFFSLSFFLVVISLRSFSAIASGFVFVVVVFGMCWLQLNAIK